MYVCSACLDYAAKHFCQKNVSTSEKSFASEISGPNLSESDSEDDNMVDFREQKRVKLVKFLDLCSLQVFWCKTGQKQNHKKN